MDSTTAPAKKPGLLINRNFALLWAGGAISVFGDIIFDFTLALWIFTGLAKGQPWAPLAVVGIFVAASLPIFLIGPIAGVFVDRWDKRRNMLRMDALRAVLIGMLVLSTNIIPLPFLPDGKLTLDMQLGVLYGVVFLASALAQFFNPARMALIGDIVDEPYRGQASGMTQTVNNIALLLGPALAPPLFILVGPEWAIGINALSFVVSFIAVLAIRAPESARSVAIGEKGNFAGEFFAGLRFTLGNRILSTLLIGVLLVMFGASTINALDIVFALDTLHAPTEFYGLLTAIMGLGATVGAITASVFIKRLGLVRTLTFSLLGSAIGILIYSRMIEFGPALAVMGTMGIFTGALNVPVGPLLLRVTPRTMIGRVSATINPLTAFVTLIGGALSGYLAGDALVGFHQQLFGFTFGPVDTIFTVGALITLGGAIYSMIRLGFRDPEPLAPKPSTVPEVSVLTPEPVIAE